MKKLINKVILALLFFVLVSPAMAAPGVSFNESKIKLRAGNVFVLDILMSDFPLSEGGGVTLKFDSAVIRVDEINVNTESWNFVSTPGRIKNTDGIVSDVLFSSYKGVLGDALIATVTFTALQAGKSVITIEESSVNPFSSDGNKVIVNFDNANVHVIPMKGVR
ncbi:MAG: hypothetical protein DIZ80_17470 [endosymbiont of Galathealinum brachiosum]|uniref:Cohesin domain-containing protein n=1 Tax=endosymbiont of Galathealinum brachiosum TaxID=2200906 RepID=A0A370D745_9GAMM|nr:MAG: hypothetical protein DIZ80_17470 [endosymbiont of Galathealinum brachiosum]